MRAALLECTGPANPLRCAAATEFFNHDGTCYPGNSPDADAGRCVEAEAWLFRGTMRGAMPSDRSLRNDDTSTIAAVSVVAYILQDVLHEGVGHGLTAWLSGAHRLTMSTVALQSDIDTRWISANGTLVNLLFAGILWIPLRKPQGYAPVTFYFLVLAMAGNLFTGTGYFLFSGVTDFGDWAAVIRGLEPHWLWRVGLIVIGAASYYASLLLVGSRLRHFLGEGSHPGRLRRLSWTPYVVEGLLAGVAGVFYPAGLFYVIASALPSTLGANAGLLSLPGMMRGWALPVDGPMDGIRRSTGWISAAVLLGLLSIVVLGRGVSWSE